jgi:hypothetical protein
MHNLTHDAYVKELFVWRNQLSLGLIVSRLWLGLGLRRGQSLLDGDGVDLRHVLRQRGVHHPMPLQQPFPLELLGHHLDLVARTAPSHRSVNQQTKKALKFSSQP